MTAFKALVVRNDDDTYGCAEEQLTPDDLMEGDVTVRVTHSTVNYKDGLAITGKAPVVRRFPMIPGIDFAGVVEKSSSASIKEGQQVILNGFGVGETHMGGFAEYARVKSDWLLPLPDGISAAQAMAVGTAGYTAALCVMALEDAGLKPEMGEAVVTGAAGGVGSISVALLAASGWKVTAVSGRSEQSAFLQELGAHAIVPRAELTEKPRALGKERWIAGIDVVGSNTLANVLSMTKYGGAIAACGMAGGMSLPASVAPFILRNVSLLGVDSVMAPLFRRERAWALIAERLEVSKLDGLTTTIGFDAIARTAHDILEGKVRGRVLVEMS